MSPNDADGMANSVDPDQTAPLEAVWSGSALFAQAYLSENLGSLRYVKICFYHAYTFYKHIEGRSSFCMQSEIVIVFTFRLPNTACQLDASL